MKPIETYITPGSNEVCARAVSRFETLSLRFRITRWADHSSMQISIDGKEPGTPNVVFFLEETEVQWLTEAIKANFEMQIH